MIENKLKNNSNFPLFDNEKESLLSVLRSACKKIAPVWPLERFVAVNPYLGLTDRNFDTVAMDLARAGDIQMTLPSSFYLQKIQKGTLKLQDIASVLSKKQMDSDVNKFLDAVKNNSEPDQNSKQVMTFAEVAAYVSGKDWNRFMTSRISTWAASYFNKDQAIWTAADQNKNPFKAWKEEAEIDRSPEFTGLKNFRKTVKSLPEDALEAAKAAMVKLDIPEEGLDIYLHSLLLRLGGWSAYAARIDWDNELYGGQDGVLIEFLAVLLSWEVSLLSCIDHHELEGEWNKNKNNLSVLSTQKELNLQLTQKLILQEAFDLSTQRQLIDKFQGQKTIQKKKSGQSKAQAIFCIDVRSEVFRRNLELADSEIETLGFAGFFAFPINYVPLGHEEGEAQCPVLLKTGPTILEEMPDQKTDQTALNDRIFHKQVQQVWKTFKSGAVSCFSFVSPIGMSYLPKLFSDSFGITRPVAHPYEFGMKNKFFENRRVSLVEEKHQNEAAGIALDQQIQMAKNALNAMSLKDDFAKFVMIIGHGSSMVNNPHATGYDCGACGGHSGESNAKVAAAVLNNREVRIGLQKENIFIPVDTVFLACLHDTTTDEVKIFNEYDIPSVRRNELDDLKKSLKLAGKRSRAERSPRLSKEDQSDTDKSIFMRSRDWSQTRPEWGLAGCSAFVVAPRERTKGINLEGRSFLHSYEWKNDENFAVLELIMTAPMVVTSWISLQYFASTVDNKVFGCGNKTLHNVTSGVGVLEGFSGDLRVGLPLQAVHDGENFQHEPVKLNVIIEAPIEAMNTILKKHNSVRELCENGWLHLLAMDEEGIVSHRYQKDFKWEELKRIAA